ncbi:YcbK family protein [Beggiatoa leptomitoformis]|uniref:Murein endopeptidase K n=1 Tax=Beggiatoa leptomitoformis TaxID=288004 RepID=A0A2N9YCD2_9GAMM|nr:DUF882 domain-containing protein [Beggiatoa leptomitoformis]ALG66581.1 DUF882 domain-containing protein [Beggiatoa leptomitoformis]AUI68113.1 DUF882 domain-containing protein [Beggiatoa leptomitoformis]
MTFSKKTTRRQFLYNTLIAGTGLLTLPNFVYASQDKHKTSDVDTFNAIWDKAQPLVVKNKKLAFSNLNTNEELELVYWSNGSYVKSALDRINQLFRDHRTDEVHVIDPNLLDLFYDLQQVLSTPEPLQLISGFRSPDTNAMLRGKRKNSGVAKNSLHMIGKAADIRLPDKSIDQIYQTAVLMQRGGVGYYSGSNFVHVDVGNVRSWGKKE